MTRSGWVSRAAVAQIVMSALLAGTLPCVVHAAPSAMALSAQPPDIAAFQARFDRALAVFNSAQQPEAIPLLSQLIDDLSSVTNRTTATTTLLARTLQYRAQARENVGQTAEADADLRQIRDVAPAFRLTDSALSVSLVNRFNALTPQTGQVRIVVSPADASVSVDGSPVDVRTGTLTLPVGRRTLVATRAGYTAVTQEVDVVPSGTPPVQISLQQERSDNARAPRRTVVSAGYEHFSYSDCSDCNSPGGWYVDAAGSLLRRVSWVAEVSGSSWSCALCSDENGRLFFFGGGVRFHVPGTPRLVPFGELLFGRTRSIYEFGCCGNFTDTHTTVRLGGAVDVALSGRWGVRGGLAFDRWSSGTGNPTRAYVGVARTLP